MNKEPEFAIPEYDRAQAFPSSHECSHHVKLFNGPCIRPAYKQSKDGRWWCETCYILNSGDIDRKKLPLAKQRKK